MTDNVSQFPVDRLIQEGISQKDRIVIEVMKKLYELLPDRGNNDKRPPDFNLEDGREAWIVKFSEPKIKKGGQYHERPMYGFDVQFKDGAICHLEFHVKCTGWERGFI